MIWLAYNTSSRASFGHMLIVVLVVALWTNRDVASFLPSASISVTSTCASHGRSILALVVSANHCRICRNCRLFPDMKRGEVELYSKDDENDYASQGIVSIMTNLVNIAVDSWSVVVSRSVSILNPTALSATSKDDVDAVDLPSSSQELLERIREDYTMKNYLWTGDLDLENNFDPRCRFTDPTLSFIGTDQYSKNIRNLRPILDRLTNVSDCRSDLLQIQSCDQCIQTRWNMVGTLTGLPWQPKIDVIGQTKFWYKNDTFQIYFYDEVWEIPASQALLQLITPAGTIPNRSS